MPSFVITTDSTVDLSADWIKKLEISVIPLSFTICGETYTDGALASNEFYNMLRQGYQSQTTQINAEQCKTLWDGFLADGLDILHIGFSSGLSGSYQSACIAAEDMREKYPEREIIVVDTLSASRGEGLLAYHASMMRKSGASITEIAAWLEANKLRMCHLFTVDDLNHLKRGGRVSATVALIGSILGIKPIMRMDDEGHLVAISKVRGRKASLDALADRMRECCIRPEEQMIFISHGDVQADAEYLAGLIRHKMEVKDISIGDIGPVIGSHSGPGTVALFFLAASREP